MQTREWEWRLTGLGVGNQEILGDVGGAEDGGGSGGDGDDDDAAVAGIAVHCNGDGDDAADEVGDGTARTGVGLPVGG